MPQDLTYICPSCGGEVRVGGSCKGCPKKKKPTPAKTKRPRKHDEIYDGLDLPDDDFDYDEFVAREFGRTPHKKIGVKWYWWLLGVLVLVLMLLCLVFQGHVFIW
jgi:hypothetical protein